MTTLAEARAEAYRHDYVVVPELDDGTMIVVTIADRTQFDRIAVQTREYDFTAQGGGHSLQKTVQQRMGKRSVTVGFFYWVKRP